MTREIWLETGSKSVILMRPVDGGGVGYNVQLQTTLPVGAELTRCAYVSSIGEAAHRIVWLQGQVPGNWER